MLDSKDGTHKQFSQKAIPQWLWFVANPKHNANDPDYSLAYSLRFATSQHAHNQHLQTSAMHMQNRIHKNKNVKHKYYFQSCFTIEPGKIIQAKCNIANILSKRHIRIVLINCQNSKLNTIKKQSKNKKTLKQQTGRRKWKTVHVNVASLIILIRMYIYRNMCIYENI